MSRKTTYYNHSFASVLTPAQIFGANYYDHWRAEDLVLSNNDLVSSWTSIGLNGADFTSSGSNRPIYLENELNTYPVVHTPGNRWMDVNNSTAMYNFLHNGQSAVIAVARETYTSNANVLLSNTVVSGGVGLFILRRNTNNQLEHLVHRGVSGSRAILNQQINVWDTQYNIIVSMLDATAIAPSDRSIMQVNGGALIQNNTENTTFSPNDSQSDLTLFARAEVRDLRFRGDLAELLIIDTLPTTQQLNQLQAYFTNKYGTFPI